MSKKNQPKNQPAPPRQFPWLAFAGGGAILLILAGLALWWSGSGNRPSTAPQAAGTPRLVVDQTTVDHGYVKFSTPVQATFKLSNQGSQPLQILTEPKVELIEGC